MKCKDCEMYYVPQTDFDYHRRYHDEFCNGVKAKPTKREHLVYRRDGLRIVVVTPTSPWHLRMRAQKVAERAHCETRYDFGIYNALAPFGDVMLVHRADRAIGLLIVVQRPPVWRFTWEEYDQRKDPELFSDVAKLWTVDFVWILPEYRGRGLATLLLKGAGAWTGLLPSKFAWLWPFSESGERFVRRNCPGSFFIA